MPAAAARSESEATNLKRSRNLMDAFDGTDAAVPTASASAVPAIAVSSTPGQEEDSDDRFASRFEC